MLTNGPNATVGEVLEVDLPRPRDRLALASEPKFLAAREAVLRFLHERHALPAAAA
jgi:nitrate/nitrite transport system ATP-binding protein